MDNYGIWTVVSLRRAAINLPDVDHIWGCLSGSMYPCMIHDTIATVSPKRLHDPISLQEVSRVTGLYTAFGPPIKLFTGVGVVLCNRKPFRT
jgi:hypothetical protein